jgi:hypothetical protein
MTEWAISDVGVSVMSPGRHRADIERALRVSRQRGSL